MVGETFSTVCLNKQGKRCPLLTRVCSSLGSQAEYFRNTPKVYPCNQEDQSRIRIPCASIFLCRISDLLARHGCFEARNSGELMDRLNIIAMALTSKKSNRLFYTLVVS